MLGGRPGPDRIASGVEFVDHLVAHLALAKSRNGMPPPAEYQHVPVGQSFPVMVLEQRAAGNLCAALPDDAPLPVDQADFLVRIDADTPGNLTVHGAKVHTGGLDTDHAARAVDGLRIDHLRGVATEFP